MAGLRFVLAGSLIVAWARLRGAAWPDREHWRSAAVIGVLMLMGGNGAVTWSVQRLPTGVAALMVAITPCWMVLLDWLRPRGERPRALVVAGLALGMGGIALLVGPDQLMGGGRVDPLGALALMLGSVSWSVGSIYSRHASLPRSAMLGTGMQMLCGGGALLLLAGLTGEMVQVHPGGVSAKSVVSFFYLVFFGAIIGYSAYIWLLRVTSPARVATYAYVNPVVAVLLGWLLGGEVLTARIGLAAAVILAGVALITLSRGTGARRVRSGRVPADTAVRGTFAVGEP